MTISEKTGFALSLVLGMVGVAGSGMWWASSVQARQSSLMAEQEVLRASVLAVSEAYKLRDAELQRSVDQIAVTTAEANAKLSLLIDFIGADEVGPPKRLRKGSGY